MAGFVYDNRIFGGSDVMYDHLQLGPSQTVVKGDALKLQYGKLVVAGTTDAVQYIAAESKSSSTTDKVVIKVIPTLRGNAAFRVRIAPTALNVSNTGTTVQVKVAENDITGDGASNDLRGCVLLVVSTGERRIIASNSYAGSVNTIVVAEPFNAALAVGDDVKILTIGPGFSAQLNGEDSVSFANVAGATGGKVNVIDVNDDLTEVYVSFIP